MEPGFVVFCAIVFAGASDPNRLDALEIRVAALEKYADAINQRLFDTQKKLEAALEEAVAKTHDEPPVLAGARDSTGRSVTKATAFGDGAWEVGVDIQHGTYKTQADVKFCFWETLRGDGSSIDTEMGHGQAIAVIDSKIAIFKSTGCGIWRKTS